jgi:hypothetical protein
VTIAPVTDETPLEDLTFRPASGPTLGVEPELQVLDRDGGDLAPGAVRILPVCAEEDLEAGAAS